LVGCSPERSGANHVRGMPARLLARGDDRLGAGDAAARPLLIETLALLETRSSCSSRCGRHSLRGSLRTTTSLESSYETEGSLHRNHLGTVFGDRGRSRRAFLLQCHRRPLRPGTIMAIAFCLGVLCAGVLLSRVTRARHVRLQGFHESRSATTGLLPKGREQLVPSHLRCNVHALFGAIRVSPSAVRAGFHSQATP